MSLARLLLAIAAGFSLPARADPDAYTGKYAFLPEFQELAGRLPEMKAEAARIAAQRLGIEAPDASNVVVVFRDMPWGERREFEVAGTATRVRDGRIEQVITLHPESHFAGGDVQQELTHEMVHALMRNALGEEGHERVPKWAREGLALWAAGQGPERVQHWLTHVWEGEPAEGLVDGLEGDSHTQRDYAEDYLALALLEAEAGESGVRGFAGRLLKGVGYREAIAAAFGGTWAEFERRARAFARERIRFLHSQEGADMLRSSLGSLEVGDHAAALRLLEAVRARWPDGWASAVASFAFAVALQSAGQFADAADAWLEFRYGDGRLTGLLDDAAWRHAGCLEALKRPGEAIAELDRLARDFPWSRYAAPAMLRASGLDRSPESRDARLRLLIERMPGSREAAEAGRRLGR